jgi:hypothetical protein
MLQAVTHDPRAGLSPSQLRLADERIARLARIAAAASSPAQPRTAPAVEPAVQPVEAFLALKFKEPWFHIEFEYEDELRIETIQKVVLARFPTVTRNDINSARRTKDVVLPRQIAMYLARHLTPKSLPAIGRGFGGRDHTTALSAIRKIEGLIAVDPELAADVAAMADILRPRGVA